ncbi:MAG: hypothetical protein ACLQMO_05715, partial [Acidobacteriaceae bacterium]
AMNPLRPATITPNFYRVAHKEIVGHAGAYVYTARPGRLRNNITWHDSDKPQRLRGDRNRSFHLQ